MFEPLYHVAVLKPLLVDAITTFNATERDRLLRPQRAGHGPGERSIGATLKTHVERIMRQQLQVPEIVALHCDYTQFGDDSKRLDGMEQFRADIKAAGRKLNSRGQLLFSPDLIVHEVGEEGTNYLVVEIKRDSKADEADITLDQIKLRCMTNPARKYRYLLGAEVRVHDTAVNRSMSVVGWCENGTLTPVGG